jgi:hypothetical protein
MEPMTMDQLNIVREEGGEYLIDLEVPYNGEPITVLVAGELEIVHPNNWLSRGDSPPDDPETTGSWEIVEFILSDDRKIEPGTEGFKKIEQEVFDVVAKKVNKIGL